MQCCLGQRLSTSPKFNFLFIISNFTLKKPDSIKVGLYKGVVSKDAMKLRKTGFESLRSFVIHRAKHTSKGVARHWNEKLVSAFHNF